MVDGFKFLQVKQGRTFFAHVFVTSDGAASGVSVSNQSQNERVPNEWFDAAVKGAKKALDEHIHFGGNPMGLLVTDVLGTEVDSNENTIEVATFFAAWEALGHSPTDFTVSFDGEWRVSKST
jgi:hypothetical protein